VVADYRGTAGWTWFSLLYSGRRRYNVIWVSAGALHYLEPDELQGLIAHEIGHHDSANRCDAPGGWLMADLALFALMFRLTSPVGLEENVHVIWPVFLVLRTAMAWVVVSLRGKLTQTIEHLCDLYGAEQVGREAMVNMLLKLGEEEELTEAVVARTARELLHVKGVEMEDLTSAFLDVRPYGRIFHDNLFHHAAQVVAKVTGDFKPTVARVRTTPNAELKEFLVHRRQARSRRIRWRSFDGDGDGKLTASEIDRLCDAVRHYDSRALFLCETERSPTSHPTFRDRILMLCDQCRT